VGGPCAIASEIPPASNAATIVKVFIIVNLRLRPAPPNLNNYIPNKLSPSLGLQPNYYVVRDADGQQIAYVSYRAFLPFEGPPVHIIPP
jgi:hypothetical protein